VRAARSTPARAVVLPKRLTSPSASIAWVTACSQSHPGYPATVPGGTDKTPPDLPTADAPGGRFANAHVECRAPATALFVPATIARKRGNHSRPGLVTQPPVRSVGSMSRSLGQRADRLPPGPEPVARARGARASFVLRRLRSARLLPASLLLAVLTSTMVTVGLASFGARALPAAEHRRLANVANATIEIRGQVGTARADADARIIRSSISSALGGVPFGMLGGRWSDHFTLPKPRGAAQAPQIQAAVLRGVTAHARLTAGHWPGPRRPGQPIPAALPASTAATLHFA